MGKAMSLTDRLAEVGELLIGLGVAVVIIVVIAWLIGMAGPTDQRGDHAQSKRPTSDPPAKPGRDQHQERPPRASSCSGAGLDAPMVAALYIAPSAGRPMERTERAEAVAGRGLVGDRYHSEMGHWSGTDECEVTIIAQEDLDEIERLFDVRVQNGEHRRNIVLRNLPVQNLVGRRFQIGSASFGYERPRPPCAYIQMVSEAGMTKALGKRAGICVRCSKSGLIQEGDRVVISHVTVLQLLKHWVSQTLRARRTSGRLHR